MDKRKERSTYYQALKQAGVPLEKPYNQYTVEELATMAKDMLAEQPKKEFQPPAPDLPPVRKEDPPREEERVPRSNVNEDEYAGVRLNSKAEEEIIRVDDAGRRWIQEEVRKPAFPKPRGRRVMRYLDPGTATARIGTSDQYESFEVGGTSSRPAEIKVTLPSFQTGIYRHPSYPFKIHTYGGREGFNLFEVNDYFGGADLVPTEIKRIYISNDLCYDIRTTKRAIETIARHMRLR